MNTCPEDKTTLLSVPMNPNIGRMLGGKYEIVDCIGEGGMGAVYKAKDLPLDRWVAIKLLHPQRISDPQALRRFQQEAKAAVALTHPNLVLMREFGIDEQTQEPYLVMDFVNGCTLADIIENDAPLPLIKVTGIFEQICAGLNHAHSMNVIHRDIKPSNIMINEEDGSAKIVDFGIAKLLVENQRSKITETGEVFGSPLYMSPEQCKGETVDRRSDIYSIGVVLFETLCAQPPVTGSNALETIQRKLVQRPAQASSLRQDLPPAIDGIMDKALALKPEDRYNSLADLMKDLHLIGRSLPVPATQNNVRTTSEQLSTRARNWSTSAVCFAAITTLLLVMTGINRTVAILPALTFCFGFGLLVSIVTAVYFKIQTVDRKGSILALPDHLRARHKLLLVQLQPDVVERDYLILGEAIIETIGDFRVNSNLVLSDAARTNNPHIVVFGNRDTGKTSLLASWLNREMLHSKRNIFVIASSPKLMTLTLDAQVNCLVKSIRLGTDGATLNPFAIESEQFAACCKRASKFALGDKSNWQEQTSTLASACATIFKHHKLDATKWMQFLVDDSFREEQCAVNESSDEKLKKALEVVRISRSNESNWKSASSPLLEFVDPALNDSRSSHFYSLSNMNMQQAVESRTPIFLVTEQATTASGALLANLALTQFLSLFSSLSDQSDELLKCSIYVDSLDEFADLETLEYILSHDSKGVELICSIARPAELSGKIRHKLLDRCGHLCSFALDSPNQSWVGEHIFNKNKALPAAYTSTNLEVLSGQLNQTYVFSLNYEAAGLFQIIAPTMQGSKRLDLKK
ncbi:MAG TPA: serine/threonine-protein kinase [Planktothrix sp.]|jgi:serine/threonine protein kinase